MGSFVLKAKSNRLTGVASNDSKMTEFELEQNTAFFLRGGNLLQYQYIYKLRLELDNFPSSNP